MTVLVHQVFNSDGTPAAGRVATVKEYDGTAGQAHSYRRVREVTAVSDANGWLNWYLPRTSSGDPVPVYIVDGIEAQPVLVAVPIAVSTATVAETRVGTLPNYVSATTDLVTEKELSERLAGITDGTAQAPQTDAEKEQFIPTRLSPEAIGGGAVGTPDATPDTVVRRDAFGGFAADHASLDYLSLTDPPTVPSHGTSKAYVDAQVATKITAFADPNADRLVFWDDSAGAWAPLTPGAGLTITGTTITADGAPTLANLPAGTTLTVLKSGSTWPARPTARTDIVVQWRGTDPSPSIVASGTGGMLDGVDVRFVTP